jgi:hypothetical protein
VLGSVAMINKQLNIRISPQLFESIKDAGACQNLSPSNYAIAALQYCVDNQISFLPGGVAPARDATSIDVIGTVNEILDQFRSDLRLELDSRLAEIQFNNEATGGDVSTGNEPDGDSNIPITEAVGDTARDNQDDDRRIIEIIKAGRELEPPKPFQQIADDLIKEKLTIPGKAGRNKPSRVNVAAIAKANKIP